MLHAETSSAVVQRPQFERNDVRYIGAVAGRYAMSNRRHGADGKVAVYACRLCSISTRLAVVMGPAGGKKGEVVTAHFDDFGILRGHIVRGFASGFVLELMLGEVERNKLSAKISWYKKHALGLLPERRDHRRILPRDPRTIITLGDGVQIPCFVMDISQSGVAVSAQLWPELGTPMAVGKLVGRVVRHLDVGFALQFIEVQDFDQLEALMAPPIRQ